MIVLCLQCGREFDSPVRSKENPDGSMDQEPTQDLCFDCRTDQETADILTSDEDDSFGEEIVDDE